MGVLTRRQKRFAAAYVASGSVSEAAKRAGYADHTGGVHALQAPAVNEEIARISTDRLFKEVLPLAIDAHIDLITNPATPAGARVSAVKLAYDRTLSSDQAARDKQPHEMDSQELDRALADARLRAAALASVQADRARPVIDAGPLEEPLEDVESDVFG